MSKQKIGGKRDSIESIFIPDNSHITVEQKLFDIRLQEERDRYKMQQSMKGEKSMKSLTESETDLNDDLSSPSNPRKKKQ